MKTYTTLLIALVVSITAFAQGRGMNYKAVVKDVSGNLLANQSISVGFTISNDDDTSNFYSETHNPVMTDANGIISVNIGEGVLLDGDWSTINWSSANYSLTTFINIDGSAAINMGTVPFKAVPYAYSSMDNLWQLNGNNAIAISEKVGIGTSAPEELLSLSDPDDASIKLQTNTTIDTTSISFQNGPKTGLYSHYKIENVDDNLKFELDTDLNNFNGYQQLMSLNDTGLALLDGTRIGEFSIDGTLAGNSNDAVPTEAAVKTYVDNALTSTSKSIVIPATAFYSSDSNFNIFNNTVARITSGVNSMNAPIILPTGSTITNITANIRDNDTNNDIEIRVLYTVGSAFIPFSSSNDIITSSGASTTGQTQTMSTSMTIFENRQYSVNIRPNSNWTGADLGICSIQITYTE